MMTASTFRFFPLTVTCWVPGRAICRSIVQVVSEAGAGAGELVRAPLAVRTGKLTPAPAYVPVISKLDPLRPASAPVSRARVDGVPRPKGRSQAESAMRTATPASAHTARWRYELSTPRRLIKVVR